MQKNQKYLLIGNGRLASHLAFYFDYKNMECLKWNRSANISLISILPETEKILLAISDDAIEKFITTNSKNLMDKTIIHFSGNLSLNGIESAHPLMTFGDTLYPEEFYETIPFITEKGKSTFKELFPELSNPNYQINSTDKPLYHAWCSMAGNFTTILWKSFENRLTENFNIPKEVILPYLNKITENIIHSKNPLTGPFVRKDFETIKKHREALRDDSFLNIYDEFFNCYFNKKKKDEAYFEDSC